MDERFTLHDILIDFSSSQKQGKTQIKFHFEEQEEKPSELTFTIPNPFASKWEMMNYLKRRIEEVLEKTSQHEAFQDIKQSAIDEFES